MQCTGDRPLFFNFKLFYFLFIDENYLSRKFINKLVVFIAAMITNMCHMVFFFFFQCLLVLNIWLYIVKNKLFLFIIKIIEKYVVLG